MITQFRFKQDGLAPRAVVLNQGDVQRLDVGKLIPDLHEYVDIESIKRLHKSLGSEGLTERFLTVRREDDVHISTVSIQN